ncbi:MAG: hypothetical protein IPJ27_05655 [Candidatus Accumulibacter sp.]|uniref:Uncharacterized protein n=1 Tax=Candidatus Accumulibacter proximus TaxID=2954385 RepID=A0A935PYJ6_9PROT|nr:hypothetical protein [Candidatus Accumulibacter proximus]
MNEMNNKGMRYPRKLKAAVSTSPLVMESMQHLMTAYGRFVQAGATDHRFSAVAPGPARQDRATTSP